MGEHSPCKYYAETLKSFKEFLAHIHLLGQIKTLLSNLSTVLYKDSHRISIYIVLVYSVVNLGMVENAGTGCRIRIPDTDTGYGYQVRIPDTRYGYRTRIPDTDTG